MVTFSEKSIVTFSEVENKNFDKTSKLGENHYIVVKLEYPNHGIYYYDIVSEITDIWTLVSELPLNKKVNIHKSGKISALTEGLPLDEAVTALKKLRK
jgi:hypothetical protein